MDFSLFSIRLPLRPMLYFTSISAAAVTSLLLNRWIKARRPSVDAVQTETFEDLKELAGPSAHLDYSCEDVLLDTQCPSSLVWCGPLVTFRERCGFVQRANRMFAYTLTQMFSGGNKLVEVTLQHRSSFDGLVNEHWWVLTNKCYNLFPEELQIPPQFFAIVKVVAYIKRCGHQISVVTVNLTTEASILSVVRSQFQQAKVSRTHKRVAIDEVGCFHSSESSDTHILETPLCFQPLARPLGPPPGFH